MWLYCFGHFQAFRAVLAVQTFLLRNARGCMTISHKILETEDGKPACIKCVISLELEVFSLNWTEQAVQKVLKICLFILKTQTPMASVKSDTVLHFCICSIRARLSKTVLLSSWVLDFVLKCRGIFGKKLEKKQQVLHLIKQKVALMTLQIFFYNSINKFKFLAKWCSLERTRVETQNKRGKNKM